LEEDKEGIVEVKTLIAEAEEIIQEEEVAAEEGA